MYCTVLYCTVTEALLGMLKARIYCKYTVLYCTVLYYTVMDCTVLYCTVLYWYCTVLYCTVLHCTALHFTVLYCTVLYCSCTVLYLRLYLVCSQPECTVIVTTLKKYKSCFQLEIVYKRHKINLTAFNEGAETNKSRCFQIAVNYLAAELNIRLKSQTNIITLLSLYPLAELVI